MKKILAIILVPVFIISLAACGKDSGETTTEINGNSPAAENETAAETTVPETTELVTVDTLGEDKKEDLNVLVAYFSDGDEVKEYAEAAAAELDADIFRIETAESYPEDELERNKRILDEKEKGLRPMLKNNLADTGKYDIVLLGFPVWENSLPGAVCTFIEDHDMYGKAIIPFCAGDEGNSLNELASLCRLDKMTLHYATDGDGADLAGFALWLDSVIYG